MSFGLPSGWGIASLGEAATVVNGGTPKSKVAEYWVGDVQWLTPKDMGKMEGREISSTPRTISASGLAKSSARQIPPKSVILSTRAPIGHLAINSVPMAFNQGCRGIIPGKKLDHVYLYYFLAANREKLDGLGSGTTFKELSATNLKSVALPLPPLKEQKRIVAVLDQAFAALDRARAHAEANLADAEELYLGTLRELFQRRTSWTSEDLNKRVRFIDYRGKTPPKRDTGIRLITAKNVRMGYIKTDPREFVLEAAYDEWMTRGFPEIGDVLFTTEAPLANVAELDTSEKVVIGQRLITMQTDRNEIHPRFLKWSLLSPQMQQDIRDKGTGATVTGIKASLLKKIRFYVPPTLEAQIEIAEKGEAAFALRDSLTRLYQDKITNIADLRQALLQKAFSGQLT